MNFLNVALVVMMSQSQRDCDERQRALIENSDRAVDRVDYRAEKDIQLYTKAWSKHNKIATQDASKTAAEHTRVRADYVRMRKSRDNRIRKISVGKRNARISRRR